MPLTEEEKKQRINQSKKKYRENNREKINKKQRDKRKTENRKEKDKKYSQSVNGIKNGIKSNWKARGLIMDNFEELYKLYLETTNCDICDRILTKGTPRTETTKCMDHNHETGEFRAILCHSCNVRRK